ncbi:TRAP transporter large permease [uncultured Maritimibacter sp.]|jgi:tripartite ATP-independent transporter DctM subunit|uniref:TRAP transporter large permease n=1 Tax=uncultured Maritimibacter sp. TaxID=991866 RepID=UPI000A8522B6|nr:TRAP transporter large permease subunit [uncultured Maritimibacter sp.]
MSIEIGFYAVGILGLLLVLRVPVALALILVSFGGIWAMIGLRPALGILENTPYSFVASWTMSAVPMFLLMGFVAYHTGLTAGLFDAAKVFLARLPGGLAISSIFACSGFAALSGSSIATAAAMGRIAIPEMIRAGYNPSIATGSIAAGGTIGALIPPSILMIIYGIIAETSVTQVFMGGISIGIATAIAYSLVVLIISLTRPDIIPPRATVEPGQGARVFVQLLPVLVLILIVFGGLFSGLFTATEAGAVGALGTFIVAGATGKLTRVAISRSLIETVTTTGSLLIIGIGATMFTRFLGLSGLQSFIANTVAGADIGYVQLMIIIVLIYLVLGMFMEPFGAMLVTLPVFLPVLEAQQVSLVWFGVFVVKMLEIGMITPPVGLNVFVIRNVASQYASVVQIFKGVIPFLIADMFVIALVIAVPAVVLWLPGFL